MASIEKGPYTNADGGWWVGVEDVNSFQEARHAVLDCLDYEVPDDGRLKYIGKFQTSVCDAPNGAHDDILGGLDPANCDSTCYRPLLAYYFEERRRD